MGCRQVEEQKVHKQVKDQDMVPTIPMSTKELGAFLWWLDFDRRSSAVRRRSLFRRSSTQSEEEDDASSSRSACESLAKQYNENLYYRSVLLMGL